MKKMIMMMTRMSKATHQKSDYVSEGGHWDCNSCADVIMVEMNLVCLSVLVLVCFSSDQLGSSWYITALLINVFGMFVLYLYLYVLVLINLGHQSWLIPWLCRIKRDLGQLGSTKQPHKVHFRRRRKQTVCAMIDEELFPSRLTYM